MTLFIFNPHEPISILFTTDYARQYSPLIRNNLSVNSEYQPFPNKVSSKLLFAFEYEEATNIQKLSFAIYITLK